MPVRKARNRGSASTIRPLSEIDARSERLPSSRVKLTVEESELLKDPDWIDEDEADLILAMRTDKETKLSDCAPGGALRLKRTGQCCGVGGGANGQSKGLAAPIRKLPSVFRGMLHVVDHQDLERHGPLFQPEAQLGQSVEQPVILP